MGTLFQGKNGKSATNPRQQGLNYERLARRHLESAGLNFIAANICMRGGELDLIMLDNRTWVFVEVRYRKSAWFGGAAASITPNKWRRLRHAAAVWLAGRGLGLETTMCRFDVVAIDGLPPQITWFPNALNLDR